MSSGHFLVAADFYFISSSVSLGSSPLRQQHRAGEAVYMPLGRTAQALFSEGPFFRRGRGNGIPPAQSNPRFKEPVTDATHCLFTECARLVAATS